MMTSEGPTNTKMIAHPDTNMEFKKPTFGKRISQFLSKVFWHFDQQAVPNYSFKNRNGLQTSSSKRSITKHGRNSSYQISRITRDQYPALYQTCSMRKRTSTLTSITEE